jgi:hypothetical protein
MRLLSLLFALLPLLPLAARQRLPDGITVCNGTMHVQGIAVDTARQCIYFSFTTRFIRTDLEGHLLGSVDRIPGHLGAIALDPADGRVYASLEYKDDEIGRGIARQLGTDDYTRQGSVFSIAVIDGPHITREGMTMDDGVFSTVRLPDVIRDYCDSVRLSDDDTLTPHRYACSGIDGVAFAPAPGKPDGRHYLYVAYGIYGDTTRTDNDCQVLLRYDISRWTSRTTTARPAARYFVPTGNTTYGVQNMAYDAPSRTLLLAVYPGRKSHLPNYSLYGVDLSQRSRKTTLPGVPYAPRRVQHLALSPYGEGRGPIRGWHNRWGATGIAPLGDSLFFLSENSRQPDGTQCCTLHLVRFTPTSTTPFEPQPIP